MSVSIRDARQSVADRAWIERAYAEYLDDLAAGHTGVFPSLTVTGQRPRDLLAPWYRDAGSAPFVILRAGEPIGFALVQGVPAHGAPAVAVRLTEFFIRRPLRGLGLGAEAAALIFNRYEGPWQVTAPSQQHGAVAFWKRVIGRFTGGRYSERRDSGEVHYGFSVRRAPPRTAHDAPA